MQVMTPGSIPVFLNNSGIGTKHGKVAAQIIGMDVFYNDPILLGFQVYSPDSPCQCLDSYQRMIDMIEQQNGPRIIGLDIFYSEHAPVFGFFVEDSVGEAFVGEFLQEIIDNCNGPYIVGFYAAVP